MLGELAHIHSESAVVILLFILTGQLIEEYARAGTNQQLDALSELLPPKVMVQRGGRWSEVPVKELQPGERIRIPAGGRVPADALLASASTETNESLLTGEPLPVLRRRNDRLLAGSQNVGPEIEAEVLNSPGETLLDQIIFQVEQAQATKAPAQRLADRISALFVPILLGLSALTFFTWAFLVPFGTLGMAFTFAMTVLIISCPCALGLATPVAVKVGVTRSARAGLLVREAAVLEQAAKVLAVLFDKTGTLTQGVPHVQKLIGAEQEDIGENLSEDDTGLGGCPRKHPSGFPKSC
jgi:ATPase, P-type (transporting), HAD superfamily, subfamily IC